MAGGEGKRLRPLTENCPKPMLRIKNKPILEDLIRTISRKRFQKLLHFCKLFKREYN